MSENTVKITEKEARRKYEFWRDELENSCKYLLDNGYLGFSINPYKNRGGYRATQWVNGKIHTVLSKNLRDMASKIDAYIKNNELSQDVMRKNS